MSGVLPGSGHPEARLARVGYCLPALGSGPPNRPAGDSLQIEDVDAEHRGRAVGA